MNKEDLLRMLDLEEREAPAECSGAALSVRPFSPAGRPGPSPTALELDDWALRKGRELLSECGRLQALGPGEHAVADFFASAFLPDPQLLPDCTDPARREFLAQMFQTAEYRALHTSTRLREVPSAVAAAAFAEQFTRLGQEAKDRPVEGAAREAATLRAAGRALACASREVEAAGEVAAALGLGPGCPGSNDPAAIAAVFQRVRNDPALRAICSRAGRFRRVAQSRQLQKATHGVDEVVGVTLSGDVAQVLPVELAQLAVPELEWDALRRLAERCCLAREHLSVERVGHGPVIVVVDESGSMAGEKAQAAKALALALAWVARRQKRWCALVAYSGDTGERLLSLPSGRWDERALVDWLCAFLGGGSSLDVPVREMPEYYRRLKAPAGRTDLVFVTDALVRIPAEAHQSFNAWKGQVKARLLSLVIGSEPGDLAKLSDESYQVKSLEVGEGAVSRVLSL